MKPWHKVKRWLVALFVCVHLCALLACNVWQLVPGDDHESLRRPPRKYINAIGIQQRWNMFAPQVSAYAGAPVLVIGFRDGSFEFVHAETTPELVHQPPNLLQIHKLPPEQRACRWNYHIVDGRMRKFESYTTRSGLQFLPIRTAWTRWMLVQWLHENPGRKADVVIVQFAKADVVYDGDGPLPRIDSVTPMMIEPRFDPQWPLPHAKQFPGVQP